MNRRVQIIIDLMKEDLSRELPMEDLARYLNLSPSRLRYLFKAETDLSPAQYLKHLRMQRAKQLAQGTFLNVKQIMAELGINDESHFVRDFKAAHGMTVTQCRNAGPDDFSGAGEVRLQQTSNFANKQSNSPINSQIG